MAFEDCLPIILASEGGYVVDQGGPTNMGVTMPALARFLGRSVSADDIRELTTADIAPLYQLNYYNAAHCNELPRGVDLMVFDQAVNEGVGRAIRHLQTALGITADGAFGPVTRRAASTMGNVHIILALHKVNEAYYQSLADVYPNDLQGWLNRNDRTTVAAMKMAA